MSAYLGPQMKRWPGFLWHFEHVFLPPTHTQSESLMHGLSFFHGHLDAGDGGSETARECLKAARRGATVCTRLERMSIGD